MQRKDFWDETIEKAYQRFAGSGNGFRADAPVCICGRARERSGNNLYGNRAGNGGEDTYTFTLNGDAPQN